MKKYAPIILSYGLFLGWLLSFAYNGPVLARLTSYYGLPVAPYSLTYTAAPVVFLIVYAFFSPKEQHSKKTMFWSGIVCVLGTFCLFSALPAYWLPVLALMGVGSVLYIISWSYFYTMEVPVAQKLPVMALVIFTGNVVYYLINIFHTQMPKYVLLTVLQVALLSSMWASTRTTVKKPIDIPLKQEPFPRRLIFITCLLLFLININDGLTFHAIYPSFYRLFPAHFIYYGIVPYLITLLLLFVWGRKMSLIFPVFLGTSLLGLAYLSFGLLTDNRYTYFITDTLLQSGWALMDLVLWTMLGLVASVYGRPLKICGLGFLANLFGVFAGGVVAVEVLDRIENAYLISAAFAVSVVLSSLLIVHWLDQTIEKDLRRALTGKATKRSSIIAPLGHSSPVSVRIPNREILSPREKEIADLLIRGHTNRRIAEMLSISENTMKTHTKNIYAKLCVGNKRELLQSSYSSERAQVEGE